MRAPNAAAMPIRGMKEEANSHIERHPRQIEQGTWARATQKATDLIEIADRLQSVAAAPGLERKAGHDVISAARQLVIDGTTDPQQNAAADRVQNPLEQEQAGGENGETDQRGNIVTRQDPVIDLQHEQRPGQHQNIDQAAEQTDAEKGGAAAAQRVSELCTRHRCRWQVIIH